MSTRKRRRSNPPSKLCTPSGEWLVAIGRLGRPHGVRGEIRLDPMGGLPRGLNGYERFFLGGDPPRLIEVEGWRKSDKVLLIAFTKYLERDEVSSLTGETLYVPRADLPPLRSGEYYYSDLEGCAVVDSTSGEELGVVRDVKNWGDYDMLFILSGAKEWLLPVTGEFVDEVDIENERVTVRVPEGLGP
ncbi:MAG: 16S rRNA processing protein RimM [Deltaproteobacteria bacterium]|nr:MAG: 16S rRNA processing protein RimM [Deltaproteobacteria bacterium]